jgi:GntR family transcriptional regulator
MARYGRHARDPKVTLVRAHSYLTDNAIIDDYGPKIGAHGVAVYHALNRFADRQTGICWPKIKTIGARLRLSESSVKRALLILKTVGLITIDPRWSDDGDRTSNLFTLIPLATIAKRQQASATVEESPTAPVMDGGGVTQNPPGVTDAGEVGSAGPPSEQAPENKTASDVSDETEHTKTENTCPHPDAEVSHFAGMTLCYHCWFILDERAGVGAHDTGPVGTEAMADTRAA